MTTGPTVFVVDDDDGVRDALHLVLGLAGFAVEAYPSAEAFLAAYDGHRGGCLITDIQLPGMDGLQLQAVLRGRRCPLSILVVSAQANAAVCRRALEQGAVAFLEKPFQAEALLRHVQAAT